MWWPGLTQVGIVRLCVWSLGKGSVQWPGWPSRLKRDCMAMQMQVSDKCNLYLSMISWIQLSRLILVGSMNQTMWVNNIHSTQSNNIHSTQTKRPHPREKRSSLLNIHFDLQSTKVAMLYDYDQDIHIYCHESLVVCKCIPGLIHRLVTHV